MNELSDIFYQTILKIGMKKLEHPVFHNAPIGIRFEIGGEQPVYLENAGNRVANPAYVDVAFERAISIYLGLPHPPSLLRIDGYPDESGGIQEIIQTICNYANLPLPYEQILEKFSTEDDDEAQTERIQLYWDLSAMDFRPNKLIQEIIKGDIGGYSGFVSSVYFLDANSSVLFHLYDDRGLDIVAASKETIFPLYEHFSNWILSYDREKIERLFTS